MDKKSFIAIAICVLTLVSWNFYVASHQPPKPVAPAVQVLPPATNNSVVSASDTPASATSVPVAEQVEVVSLPKETIRFTNLGGGIADITLKGHQHLAENGQHIQINHQAQIPIGAITLGDKDIGQDIRVPYAMRREGNSIIFERVTSDQIKITKKFTIQTPEKSNEISTTALEVTFTNLNDHPVHIPSYFVYTGSAEPIHHRDAAYNTSFAWYRDNSLVDKSVLTFDAGHIPLLGIETHPAHPTFEQAVDKLSWLAVKNQFYTTILTPLAPTDAEPKVQSVWARRYVLSSPTVDSAGNSRLFGIEAAIGMPAIELSAKSSTDNTTFNQSFQIYAGPTLHGRLAQLGQHQEELLKYGFTKPVSIFLLKTMNWLDSKLGNYALAIVVLTLLIKVVLLYPQIKANDSTRRMAALGPMMTEMREKYKDDPTRAQAETLKLYREYGVNPFGGCIPALIQMPIFFGFFRMLGSAAELRNSGFLWVKDLSQPDTVGHLLGFPINVLPLLWAGTMIWQMRMMPKNGDPTQQKMMTFLPLIFVFFCYNFASALALYYTMQTVLSIAQLYISRRQPVPVLKKKTYNGGSPGKGGKKWPPNSQKGFGGVAPSKKRSKSGAR